ncbi:MAG: LAGLIDADG family homing endonuclease [Candidatus Aenigmatarchaeota archaeon]
MEIRNYLIKLGKTNQNIYIHGITSLVSEILEMLKLKISISDLSKELSVHKSLIYKWKKSTPISIRNFIYLCKRLSNTKYIDEAYKIMSGFSSRNGKIIQLPRRLNNKLAYLIGVIIGDGGITTERATITISSKDLRVIKTIVDNTFNVESKIINYRNYSVLSFTSIPIKQFLMYVFDLPEGKKKNNIRVPKIIKDAPLLLQINFIRGLYDSDGSLSMRKDGRRTLAIKQSTKILLKDVLDILNKANIKAKIYPDRTMNSWALAMFNNQEIEKLLKLFDNAAVV